MNGKPLILLNQPNSKSGQDSVSLGPGRGATRYYDVLSPRKDKSKQDVAPTPSHPRIREHSQFFTNEELVEWAPTLEGIRKLLHRIATGFTSTIERERRLNGLF